MTKGSGRSDCFRVGVTYGYREYPRKGRVRRAATQVRRPRVLDGLAESFNVQNVDLEHSAHLFLLHIPRKTVSRYFFVTVYRESPDFHEKKICR
jgi:hypothetical protein